MANNKTTANSDDKKIVTKYDKKMQKRAEEAKRIKREKLIFKTVCIAVLVGIVATVLVVVGKKHMEVYKEYIVVDGESVNKIEFDFNYGLTKTQTLNTPLSGSMTYYNYFNQLMGYDATKKDEDQEYSEDLTWYDYFAQAAVDTIKVQKALLAAAKEEDFQYETADKDYDEFIDNLKEAAKNSDVSYKQYLKDTFGEYATESRIKKYVKNYLLMNAYQDELEKRFKPNEAAIKDYYNENKDTYDKYSYRQFIISVADVEDGTMESAEKKAQKFADAVDSEEKFKQLCQVNEPADSSVYDQSDASLITGKTRAEIDKVIQGWITDEVRVETDINVIEDKENSCYYIVYYISKSYNGEDDVDISNTIINEKYQDFVLSKTTDMKVDVKNKFKLLTD